MKEAAQSIQLNLFEPLKDAQKVAPVSGSLIDATTSEVKSRRLKVQYSHYPNSYRRFPVLRLAGLWLREAGFDTGNEVEVLIELGQLMITKVK